MLLLFTGMQPWALTMNNPNRRSFLKKSTAAGLALPLIRSLEEYALAAQESAPAKMPATADVKATMPMGKIGNVRISRMISGANLIGGFAHSRDLIYVSTLLKHYFTDEKVF